MIVICLACGLLAMCLTEKVTRMLVCTVSTGVTIGAVGEFLVCTALYVLAAQYNFSSQDWPEKKRLIDEFSHHTMSQAKENGEGRRAQRVGREEALVID